jgi:hypothetical protein
MNYDKLMLPLAGVVLFGSIGALRADDKTIASNNDDKIIAPSANDDTWPDVNRVSLGYRMGFNMPIKLKNVGSPAFANNPSVNGKSYADGFVGTDSTGNAGGLTTYWGYNSGSQVSAGNSALILHNSSSGTIQSDMDDGPYNGIELSFDHEIGRHQSWRWGIEGAFNWMDLSVHQRTTAPAGVLGADTFSLGYTPPSAPYTGPYNAGPYEPLLGTAATAVPVTVASSFDANFYGFRLGPYLDLPVNKHLLLTFSAGLSVTIADGSFSYVESNPMQGAASSASASDLDVLPGGYASAQATVKLTKAINVFAGLQFQSSEDYKITAGTKQTDMDLSQSLYFTTGLSYSF